MKTKQLDYIIPELVISTKVAIIGSSAMLLDTDYGKLIDTYDTIIRFNRAPVVGYEKHVGSKTTIRVANADTFSNTKVVDTRFPNADQTYPQYFISKQESISVIHANDNPNGWYNSSEHIHSTSNAFLLSRMLGIEVPGRPTVGLLTISLLLINNIVPHLFGFGLHEKSAATHYWAKRDTTSVCHNYSEERDYIKYLLTEEKVKVFV